MTSGRAEAQQTSSRLAEWLKETMKLSSARNTDVKHLSQSLLSSCKGSGMMAFWDTIMTYLRPIAEVEEVKKNVEVNDLRVKQGRKLKELQDKRRKLQVLNDEVASIKLRVEGTKENVLHLNQQVKSLEENKKLMQVKVQMYKSYGEKLEDQTTSCKSYLRWITELVETYQKNRELDIEITSLAIESAVIVLREAIKADGNYQKSLYPHIGDLVKCYSPKMITLALIRLTEEFTKRIQDDIETFDVESELSDLEHRICVSSADYGVSDVKPLKDMLEQWDAENIDIYTQLLENRLKREETIKTAMGIREIIIKRLNEEYEFEPAKLQQAVINLDREAGMAAEEARLRCFESAKTKIQSEIEQKAKIQSKITELKEMLLNYSRLVREKQENIVEMTQKFDDVPSVLQQRQQEVQNVGENMVCSQLDLVTKSCSNMRSAFRLHLSAFNHVEMSKLRQVETQEGPKPIKELTIRRYNDISEDKGRFAYQKSLCRLSIHRHVPPSIVLQKIYQIKDDTIRLNSLKASFDKTDVDKSREQLGTLHQDCIESERRILEKLNPQYKHGIKVADQAISQCSKLEESINVWFEQPAQHQIPWVKLDCMSLQEWKIQKQKS